VVDTDTASGEWAVMQVSTAHGCLDAPVEPEPDFHIELPTQRDSEAI
jgi:hypothetical protein